MAEFEEIFELPEALEDVEAIDEMGDLGDGLDEVEESALKDAEADAEEQFKDFSEEEIEEINQAAPESVNEQVEQSVEHDAGDDLSDEEQEAAKKEKLDPEKPKRNLKTRLKKVWGEYGGFLKGVGKFAVNAVGEYFKWKFIIEVVGTAQKDIAALLKVLKAHMGGGGSGSGGAGSADLKKLTSFLTFVTKVNDITEKIDTPLKIITGAATSESTDPKAPSLQDMFANYFSLRASEELANSGAELLAAGKKVIFANYNAYKKLGLPATVTEADLDKVTSKAISDAIKELSLDNLKAFTVAAQKHQVKLDKWTGQLDVSDPNQKKLKAALTLTPKYAETFTNLETFLGKASA
jgi:hypothetical protein